MRHPLLILLLNLLTLPLAASDAPEKAENAVYRYQLHLDNFLSQGKLHNYRMACLELRMASTSINNELNKLQLNSTSYRAFLIRDKIKDILAGGCKPYGL